MREGGFDETIGVRTWDFQAREITSDISTSDRYKSIALHAEVRLAEALEKAMRVSPTSTSTSGEERPNKLRTAVCCQLLGEFSDLCGPFSTVLKTLRDELVSAFVAVPCLQYFLTATHPLSSGQEHIQWIL
jgi:hypothetical protein